MTQKVLRIHPDDNVLVALNDLPKGEVIEYNRERFLLTDNIAAKHKFFMRDMKAGDEVKMYGVLVGKIQHPVVTGGLMTTTNVKHASEAYGYRPYAYNWEAPDVSGFQNKTFKGYHRHDGRVGTANYWLFIPTVFCENRNLDVIREALHNELGYAVADKYKQKVHQLVSLYSRGEELSTADLNIKEATVDSNRLFPNVDGIKFLNHQGGCGGTRQDAAILGKLLAAYADHPNVAGVTVLSLGCQNLQVKDFENYLHQRNPEF